jgi:D-3-phosphoglycerate dehydrogenase
MAEHGVRKVETVDDVIDAADYITVHVPLLDSTRNLFSTAQFARMKPNAIFINTARGAAVDEAALHKALKEKWIAGAAVDAFEVEPLPMDSTLREFLHDDNVILTPHIIGHTKDVMDAIPIVAADNVRRVARGELPLYVKNPEVEAAWRQRLARLDGK